MWWSGIIIPPILNRGSKWGERSALRHGRFTPWENKLLAGISLHVASLPRV